MNDEAAVLTERRERVLVITLNRPEQRNAVTGALAQAMTDAILHEDPEGKVVPYCMPGGTDAKRFSTLGIRCFGFSPLRLPPDLDFAGLFHGVDERVPVSALEFGTQVLDRFIDLC